MAIDHLIYLYDPLCGWCYGAMPAIHGLADLGSCIVEPVPSGLFAAPGKTLDAEMARHIEQADARIAAMSGQRFSELYKRKVLANPELPFDSTAATEALTAVSQWNVRRELDALHALQRERFVAGRDISDRDVIAQALSKSLGDDAETWLKRLAHPDLPGLTNKRVARAKKVMKAVGMHGVPALVWPSEQGMRLLPGQWLFGEKTLTEQLALLA
ncbi:DsbA family protein [Piscinibacter gummiphilus]|uniref:DsbA family protein n=1 Tax=Piscinibacter gummiphilus TaxID=946333 RepID=A0ABZ0CQ71_9BURK|nr:DsbA family protein [Piscinibacter gummiphilus]WOB07141.1 DsbA family protein [Piscinibacter gummiphilus]